MAYDKRWYLAFLDLQDYKNTYGNYKIPKDYYGERSEINLYEWYQKQRQYFKKNILAKDRVRMLDDFDIDWRKEIYDGNANHKKRIKDENGIYFIHYWDRGYKFTKEYYKLHNRLPNASYIYKDKKTGKSYHLGRWVMNQTMRYFGEKKPLPKDQQKKFSIFME